jgi:DNA modification methylase
MPIRINPSWWEKERDGIAYSTKLGNAYQYKIESFIESETYKNLVGKVDLIVTSPPFPLVSPKRYGNTTGDVYKEWIASLAEPLANLLTPTGSIVLEIGNAWEQGEPIMSTVPLETLIEFGNAGGLRICQQFICNNTARLPSPAAWVTVKRLRVKDSYTHVWWYSKSAFPKSNNANVLQPYSPAMLRLLRKKSYNTNQRPSDHQISEKSFFTDNGGSIPGSVLNLGNTAMQKSYKDWCVSQGIRPHPARMQNGLVEFFVKFLTDKSDLIFDPFGGSNTTGFVAESLNRNWVIIEPDTEYLQGSIGKFED